MTVAKWMAVIVLLLISSCTQSPQSVAARPNPTSPSLASALNYTYHCQSGETLRASYPSPERAMLRYQGREYDLHIAVAASGARYVDSKTESWVWWVTGLGAGSEAALFHRASDGTALKRVESCAGVSSVDDAR